MPNLLSKLQENIKKIDLVDLRLDALKALFTPLTEDVKVTKEGFIYKKDIEVVSIYESKEIQIIKSIYHKKDVVFNDHLHMESTEFLIVASGKIAIKIGAITRIVNQGECASIPVGMSHSVVALLDETELWAICIPPEISYSLNLEYKGEKNNG